MAATPTARATSCHSSSSYAPPVKFVAVALILVQVFRNQWGMARWSDRKLMKPTLDSLRQTGQSISRDEGEGHEDDNRRQSTNFCKEQGSLHNLALSMAHFSSPPESPSFIKTQLILNAIRQHNNQFLLKGFTDMFVGVKDNTIQALQGYGMTLRDTKEPLAANERALLVGLSPFLKKGWSHFCVDKNVTHCSQMPKIMLQSEHFAAHYKEYKHVLESCHEDSLCIVWDFSDVGYQKAKATNISDSVVLLPIMHQHRLGKGDKAPLQPLSNRTTHVTALFGVLSKRRAGFQEAMEAVAQQPQHQYKTFLGKIKNPAKQRELYQDSRVCPIIHGYPDAGGTVGSEYHRLTEFVPFGCLPVMEEPCDDFGRDIYQQCGGVVYANFTTMVATVERTLETLNDQIASRQREWWVRGIQWESLLVELFPKTTTKTASG